MTSGCDTIAKPKKTYDMYHKTALPWMYLEMMFSVLLVSFNVGIAMRPFQYKKRASFQYVKSAQCYSEVQNA